MISGLATDVQDFKVRRSAIQTIDYFEDLLLAESERLTVRVISLELSNAV